MKKIDIHAHTTNRKLENIVPKDASLKTIEEEMTKNDVWLTALLASYFPHRGSGISNYRLLNWKNQHQFYYNNQSFLFFGSLDFEKYFYQGYNELEELANEFFLNGVKIYTSYQHINLKGENFKQVLKLAEEHELPLMFHLGYTHTGIKNKPFIAEKVTPSDLEFVAEKGQNIIISHLANPFTEELIQVVKRNKTIYADMSGLIDSYRERQEIPKAIELIKKYLSECGPEKLLFGTDFPVQTHEDSVYMIEQAMKDYSEEDKQKVYWDNARKFFLPITERKIRLYNKQGREFSFEDIYDDQIQDCG